jgi:superoxide dismutase, Cu-Zn family
VPVALAATAAVAAPPAHSAKVNGTFASPRLCRTHAAVTYDRRRVPEGSRVQVVERLSGKGGDAGSVTFVTLRVWGLEPTRRYDAYVYTRRCGVTPAAAGSRTQAGPSREHYPQNEAWLNFRTNRRGAGIARVGQYWLFNLMPGQASSVVIHSPVTKARAACVTVPFT